MEITVLERDYIEPAGRKLEDAGRILVNVRPNEDSTSSYKWKYDVIEYDYDSSVYWIDQGIGFDYFLEDIVYLRAEGVFLIAGITGSYTRGDGWETDDIETWEFDKPIAITLDHISTIAKAD